MTPRAAVEGHGLRGPGQDIFPEQAKQQGRDIGLTDLAQIFRNEPEDDGGGDTKEVWVPLGEPVPARIDSVGRRGQAQVMGEQINEGTSHIVTLEPETDVKSDDRIEIDGAMWLITGEEFFTDEATVRVQVKELST